MRLVWTRQAHNDRKEIREHIARDNPVAALKLDELVSENVSRLVAYPQLGRSGRVSGTRELVAHQNLSSSTTLTRILCGCCAYYMHGDNGLTTAMLLHSETTGDTVNLLPRQNEYRASAASLLFDR